MTLQEEMDKALRHKEQCVAEKHLTINKLGKTYAEFRKNDEAVAKAYVEIYRIRDLMDKEGETA